MGCDISSDLREINAKECVGCRIWEPVCSFKHYGVIMMLWPKTSPPDGHG